MRTGSTLGAGLRMPSRRSEKSKRPILQGDHNNVWLKLSIRIGFNISHQVCGANAPAGLDCDVSDKARWTASMVNNITTHRSHPINSWVINLVWCSFSPGWLTGWGKTIQAQTQPLLQHRVPHQHPPQHLHQRQALRLLIQHHHHPPWALLHPGGSNRPNANGQIRLWNKYSRCHNLLRQQQILLQNYLSVV